MEKRADHDLLICIEQKVTSLQEGQHRQDRQFNNHLKHHFLYTLLAFSTALSAIGALVLALLHK